jgi:hypothetical protein
MATQGQTLTVSAGSWTGGPTAYEYQWESCDATGGACVDIPGANASSYTLGGGDLGRTLRVRVTARNAAGSATVTSTASEVGGVGGTTPPRPPVAGRTANVRVTAGVVLVMFPSTFGRSWLRAKSPGEFVPLKGIGAIPIGSTIDARKGALAMSTAADYRAADDAHHLVQTAMLSAAMFTVKQQLARALRHNEAPQPGIPPTDLVLTNPVAAVAAAGCRATSGPSKGVVRSLSGVAKGLYNTIGSASVTTVRDATWIVQDRCDGTLTEVGRGRVMVTPTAKAHRRRVTVTGGHAYLVKARFPVSPTPRENVIGLDTGRDAISGALSWPTELSPSWPQTG